VPDPYRVLGVAPSADDAAIRLAFRALMKRYHPDQNRSEEAAGRARDVVAAYALLSDRDRRAEFDRQRLAVEPRPGVSAARPRPVRGRAGGLLLVVLSAGLVTFAVTRPPAQPVTRHPPPQASKLPIAPPSEVAPATPLAPAKPEPPPTMAQQPTPAAPQVVALPLPPATPPVREATLLPTPGQKPLPVRPPVGSSRNPCEVDASCPAIDLAALDHHLALLTGQSLQNADPETRTLLVATQTAFRSRLSRCASAVCRRDAYLARNREIAEIMRG